MPLGSEAHVPQLLSLSSGVRAPTGEPTTRRSPYTTTGEQPSLLQEKVRAASKTQGGHEESKLLKKEKKQELLKNRPI